jgi:hypothetical protein
MGDDELDALDAGGLAKLDDLSIGAIRGAGCE